ncbi:4a-hydroxytetrahydrobiopterin dehydratase [Oxalobacteraceae bacterium R-40]|uniref:4a-hydroxytetrahydrobiopterin dehydratase n=1 Tax=Keguizhuia sedimenti TaxID=3064264 RepID=A0ABU1BMY9_9BURK|nr:4a-hydroxytetrahydrobiopterin dehydratase [Oxalobacteraceae bacterium R-40]
MTTTINQLLAQQCRHQVHGMTDAEIAAHLQMLNNWVLAEEKIIKSFSFRNYHQTIAFVHAVADVVHAEDHHPELIVTYNRCVVKFNTHSVNSGCGGISINDFICAAKIDNVFQQSFSGA